jgi:exoribonuclease II
MHDKIFGILNLSSRTIMTDSKGNIFKKFTPLIPGMKPFSVKTKKTTLTDIYALVSFKNAIVLEYFENVNLKDLPMIFAKSNWTNCFKNNIIPTLIENDFTPDRIDLTHLIAYTIDPKGSEDRDDAISYDINSNKLYIHIADPTSYIEFKSDIDKELENRCETIYLDKVQHMLPPPLSTEIISLTEGKKNRAFTLECVLSEYFLVINYKFYKSYISVKNLTYEEADIMIKNKEDKQLEKLYDIGNSFKLTKEYDIHKMVEYYMVLCNQYVAEELKNIPSIIRYNNSKLQNFNDINFKNINKKIIDLHINCKNDAASYEVNTLHNGHTILGLDHYTHFTSPLRRYTDMIVHRILYNFITNKNIIYDELFLKNICSNMNQMRSIYKYCYNLNNLNKIMYGGIQKIIDVTLVYFENDNIKLYNDEYNLVISISLIHPAIKKSTIVTSNPSELLIETNNLETNQIIKLNLFQNIKIKIYSFKLSNRLFQYELIEPVLNLI